MLDESCDMAAGHQCPYDEDATCVDAPNAPEDCWEDRGKRDKRCETYTVYQQREHTRALEQCLGKLLAVIVGGDRHKAKRCTEEACLEAEHMLRGLRADVKSRDNMIRNLDAKLAKEQEARADLVRRVEEVAEDLHFVSRWAIKEKLRDIVKEEE